MYISSSGTYDIDRSEAAEDTGTEGGCERLLPSAGEVIVVACDPVELHDENSAFKLVRKF